jgi:hypothetical protein
MRAVPGKKLCQALLKGAILPTEDLNRRAPDGGFLLPISFSLLRL